jgi:hypothetical protein
MGSAEWGMRNAEWGVRNGEWGLFGFASDRIGGAAQRKICVPSNNDLLAFSRLNVRTRARNDQPVMDTFVWATP